MNQTQFPILFKRTAAGKVQSWQICVDPHDDDTATIVTTHGLVDGKLQEVRDHIKKGKNTGKKNATNATQQAWAEAAARHTKQLERGHYGYTVEESDIKLAAAPMLAHKYQDHADKVDWTDQANIRVQPKFDGHRCLVFKATNGGVMMFSRKGVLIETCLHLREQLQKIMPYDTVLDGELYIHGEPLNKIASYIRKQQEGSARLNLLVYDSIDRNRPKLRFVERYNAARRMLDHDSLDQIYVSRTESALSLEAANEFQAMCIDNGYEGAMLRHGRYGYETGKRSHGLLKMKTFDDAEFTIVGCKEGRASYAGMAVFSCVTEDGNPFDVLAHGTHEEKRAAWINREQHIGQRLTVKYQGFTATDAPVPQFPIAKGFCS